MAPERFSTGDIAPSSDVYALACVLYQCLTGELPFPGSTLEQVAVGYMVMPPPRPSEERMTVPAAMDRVIATGLAKQPGDRYRSTVEMAAAAWNAITDPAANSSPRQPVPSDSAQTHHRQTTDGIPPPAGTQFSAPQFSAYAPQPPPPQFPAYAPPPQSRPRDILRRQPARPVTSPPRPDRRQPARRRDVAAPS
jgi:serine/threonine protein kinase